MLDDSLDARLAIDVPDQAECDAASKLTIRKLEIDIAGGFGRHWNGGDAFMTHFNNALSMSFPVGEQSFIDAVRECAKLLPKTQRYAVLHRDLDQFIGQEATHRQIHKLYNDQLLKQGFPNRWEAWAIERLAKGHARIANPMHFLALTAAFEHLTAMLSDYVLRYDTVLADAEPMMQTLWRWHAAEETEHRAVAFNLYEALGGSYAWRIRMYVYAMSVFTINVTKQTVLNLWHDKTLFKFSTLKSACQFLAGPDGIIRRCAKDAMRYFDRGFHPDQESVKKGDDTTMALARRWLAQNALSYRVVR